MASADIRKAALLLMGLEPTTAAELLRAAAPETVTQIAAELAYLQASGDAKVGASQEPVREFFEQIRQQSGGGHGTRFIQTVLENVLGADRARQIMGQISDLVDQRDPFLPLRSAEPADIAAALEGESPHVAAMVLAELPPKQSAKLLPLLADEVRAEAVRGMTSEKAAAPETRMRVATVVRKRLVKTAGGARDTRDKQLRKVALLLRGLGSDLRGTLLGAVSQNDQETATRIQELMVLWKDMALVSDRSLQEALRSIDTRELAVALVDAEEATVEKLRGNMSQRMMAMLDEEASLLSQPSEQEITEARNVLLKAVRDLAANDLLAFDED